jgi:hypothetical protein
VAFGNNKLSNQNKSFSSGLLKGFDNPGDKTKLEIEKLDNPFTFTPKDARLKSRIRFYDRDALWTRWRRGYELYTISQSVYGSTATNRSKVGDYRAYCAFQQYPGIFIPARIFTYPSTLAETKEHMVVMRDANAFNFYDFGLPIIAVRYLGNFSTVPYSQTGTTITVSYPNHGLQLNDNVYLSFLSGAGVTATLPIVSKTANSFTCTAAASATTVGNVSAALSTTFADTRWVEIRTKLQYIPTPANNIVHERFTDRVSERDPGLASSYTRLTDTVTVTCSTNHGLFTGNRINFKTSSGNIISGLYTITVTSSTQFTFTTIDSGATTGSSVVYRLIEKYNYDDYVGYTVKSIDLTNNEIVFQRADSYGAHTVNDKVKLSVPAQRGFSVGRFLTSELRYQCSCADFTRRQGYNMYSENTKVRFPGVPITSTKPGTLLNRDNTITDTRESIGVFSDLGYIATNNFYEVPDYADKKENCYTELMYYQMRWCKHIYASLFSLVHDEGNEFVDIAGSYSQTASPDIVVNVNNHGLKVNTKVSLNFTSGAALDGQYTVSQIVNANSFIIVYPYSQTTSGYCAVTNITEHDHVKQWLLEPSDHPAGDGSDTFYENFAKENSRTVQNTERAAMMKMGKAWTGSTTVLDFNNQPKIVGDFNPSLITSLLIDSIIRDTNGNISDKGTVQNTTQCLISTISKAVNLDPSLLLLTKFGFLDQPLNNYTNNYQYGQIFCGEYLNGVPTEDPSAVSVIDCDTYSPQTLQDVIIDCGTY